MNSIEPGWIAAVGMVCAVIVWLIRLEGRVNLLQAISEREEKASVRIEEKLDRLMTQRCLPLTQAVEHWTQSEVEAGERRRKPR